MAGNGWFFGYFCGLYIKKLGTLYKNLTPLYKKSCILNQKYSALYKNIQHCTKILHRDTLKLTLYAQKICTMRK